MAEGERQGATEVKVKGAKGKGAKEMGAKGKGAGEKDLGGTEGQEGEVWKTLQLHTLC